MAKKLKLVSTHRKADTVPEKAVQNSRSDRDIKYNQYRIDQLKHPIEGLLDQSSFHRWEHTIRSTTGKTFNIKRSQSSDEILGYLNSVLSKKRFKGLTQDVYRFEFLGSEKFDNGKVKKHHFKIQIQRFLFEKGAFKKVSKISISTKTFDQIRKRKKSRPTGEDALQNDMLNKFGIA